MCEYMRMFPKSVINGEIASYSPPICEHTKEFCTLCICGNGKTYEEAKRSDNNG